MAAGGEDEEASSSFRWIDAARYAVASVVTILMVVVVVKAKMVLHRKSLYLSVIGGSVLVSRSASREREVLLLDLTIRAQNPRRRVSLCYVNVTGYIFDNSVISAVSSSNPAHDSMAYFYVWDMILPEISELFTLKRVSLERGQSLDVPYFDKLYEGEGRNIIIDVTLRLDGWLSTPATSSDFNRTACGPGRRTTFYCRPLLIEDSRDADAPINRQEAFCVSGGGKTSGAN